MCTFIISKLSVLYLQCNNCKKPFSVAMLDDTVTPGQALCVFCRMERRPTIWSVVDSILNTDNFDYDNDNYEMDDSGQAHEEPQIEEATSAKKSIG